MNPYELLPNRRSILRGGLALGAAAFTTPGLFAEELTRTPALGEGPFYPDKLPLDTDNDLIIVNNSLTPAVGEITHLTGKILDTSGSPMRDVVIEIWESDKNGAYIHSKSVNAPKRDPNFQGFGKFTTGAKGEYRFRTIKPVPYLDRAPHIHFKIKKGDKELLTSQFFVSGHPKNREDRAVANVRDPFLRELLMAEFTPIKDSKVGELSAYYVIVVGRTPESPPEPPKRP